jgi:acyl-homoserine lactone acylase PvdQ
VGIVRRRSKRQAGALAGVEDPLLATAAANTATPPLTPTEEPADQFENIDTKLPQTPIEDELDEDPFETALAESTPVDDAPHLTTHAKVYAIAEK